MAAKLRCLNLVSLIVLVCLMAGCGANESAPKLAIAGSIDLDGIPLPEGTITLTSEQGISSLEVKNGRFAVPAKQGLPSGNYHVHIVSFKLTGREIPDSDWPGKTVAETRQIIPAKYNERSEVFADLSESNASSLKFELKSK